jgi:hypothetical protein
MIVIQISNKTQLIRHWLRWYRVQRGGTDWQPLKIQRRPAPFSIAKTVKMLERAQQKRSGQPANIKKG